MKNTFVVHGNAPYRASASTAFRRRCAATVLYERTKSFDTYSRNHVI
jgi:hypothetical protein